MENLVHGTSPLLLAIATMALVVRAMEWHGPFVALWRRLCRLERVLAAMALLAVVGYGGGKGTTNNPSCGGTKNYPSCGGDTDSPSAGVDAGGPSQLGSFAPPRNAAVPAWFVALGYPSTDSDGDGIPDCWERWTRTDPNADDSGLDPDGDGVDNLEEFLNQCDPMLADTDGDSLSDRYEIDSAAQGLQWADPVSPADFPGDGPDSDGDGTPDCWEGSGVRYGVSHPFSDGFPGGITWPYEGPDNIDVTATISSSRSAKLSWGDAPGQAIVVQPCTNLEVRLRLASAELTTLELSAATASSTGGLWKARMELSWGWRRHQQTDLNRVRAGNGDVLEWDAMFGEYSGPDAPAPRPPLLMASPAPGETDSIILYLRLKTLSLDVDGSCCPIHGGLIMVTATGTNVAPPYVWSVDGRVQEETNATFEVTAIPPEGINVSCEARASIAQYSNVRVETYVHLEPRMCSPPSTNVVGAAWTSTHNPTNATDHLPGVTTNISYNLGVCPPSTNTTIRVGWTHDELILHIRNLVMLLTGYPDEDGIDHCIGYKWESGGEIDLKGLLADCCAEIADRLVFKANGKVCADGKLKHPLLWPRDIYPSIYNVSIHYGEDGTALDRAWIVIYSPDTETIFSSWKAAETNLSWTLSLPKPFASLSIATNSVGDVVANPVSHLVEWEKPTAPGAYMHHSARWEMRSKADADGHGHQATYDDAGNLITSTIAAGTADKVSPGTWYENRTSNHRDRDVLPYIRALQLDGNPVHGDNMTGLLTELVPSRLSRPCVHVGENTSEYLQLRPSTPTGVQYR